MGRGVYIGLGANLADTVADRAATLRAAIDALGRSPGLTVLACSSFYVSQPVDAQGPDYVNAVVEVATDLSPQDVLALLHRVEHDFGRLRPYRNAPRTLDLDLLLMGPTVVNTPALAVPHPRLHQRAFVLLPLLELAPRLQHPLLGLLTPYLDAVTSQTINKMP
jgi:2-amino-4-hydroxy-6-hydroxymethyldihydropteridine diphosphokinase